MSDIVQIAPCFHELPLLHWSPMMTDELCIMQTTEGKAKHEKKKSFIQILFSIIGQNSFC